MVDYATFDTQTAVTLAIVLATGLSLWFLGRRMTSEKRTGGAGIRVTELNVYPVKSCGEVRPSRAVATARGFENDRIAQVVDSAGKYCTPRDRDKAKLFQIRPQVSSSASSGSHRVLTLKAAPGLIKGGAPPDPVEVDLDDESKSTPRVVQVLESGEHTLRDYGDDAASWLERATGIPGCRLAGIGRDFERSVKVNPDQGDAVPTKNPAPVALNDEAPYLLTNAASLDNLNRRLLARGKDAIDMRRFRPNIVVQGGLLRPWEEDCIKRVRVGTVEFWAWQRCGRCTMTTVDRDTLRRGPEPLNTLGTFRERAHGMRNFGMHLIPVEGGGVGGTISVGDEVEIVEYDEDRRTEWKRNFAS